MTYVQSLLQILWLVAAASPFVALITIMSIGTNVMFEAYIHGENRKCALCFVICAISAIVLASFFLWVGSGSIDISTYQRFKETIR